MEKYLEGEELTVEEIKAAIRARRSPARSPRCSADAFKNKGVQPMLDAVVDYLPTPLDVAADRGPRARMTRSARRPQADAAEPFSALAFKVAAHPFFGRLTFVRVYSGELGSRAPTS